MLIALANHNFTNLQRKTFASGEGITVVPSWNKTN